MATLANQLFSIGSWLTTPGCNSVGHIMHAQSLTSKELEKEEEFKMAGASSVDVTSRKAGLYMRALLHGVVGLVASPFGAAFRQLGLACQENGATVVELGGRAKDPADRSGLGAMVWNVACQASVSRATAGMIDWRERINSIFREIDSVDPDILCLLEVQDRSAAEAIIEKYQGKYIKAYLDMGSRAFGSNSGILILTKVPLENFTFTPFAQSYGSAKHNGMGFASFTVKASETDSIHFVATHLQYGDSEIELKSSGNANLPTALAPENTRNQQLAQICAKVATITEGRIFLMGDLNTDRCGPEYIYSLLNEGNRFRHLSTNETTWYDDYCRVLWEGEEYDAARPAKRESIDYFSQMSKDGSFPPHNTTVTIGPALNAGYLMGREFEEIPSDHRWLAATIKV